MATNPWPNERVVVVSDDPPAVEAAVVQLEQWGAQPAVMFERGRAIRALSVQEPDLVVLDFGRDASAARAVLVGLEELQPVLPGAAHPAPVVALAEGPIAPRLKRDAWAALHVVPHDDPAAVREALLAALDDAQAPGAAVAATGVVAMPVSGGATAWGRLLPVVALAVPLGIAGVAAALALGPRATLEQPAAVPTAAPIGGEATSRNVVSTVLAPTMVPSIAPTGAPSVVPAGVPTVVPAGVPVVVPTSQPSLVPATPVQASVPAPVARTPQPAGEAAAGGEVGAVTTPARLPVTGGR